MWNGWPTGPSVEHRELCSALQAAWRGEGLRGVSTRTCTPESLCCSPETITTCEVGRPQYKIKSSKEKNLNTLGYVTVTSATRFQQPCGVLWTRQAGTQLSEWWLHSFIISSLWGWRTQLTTWAPAGLAAEWVSLRQRAPSHWPGWKPATVQPTSYHQGTPWLRGRR